MSYSVESTVNNASCLDNWDPNNLGADLKLWTCWGTASQKVTVAPAGTLRAGKYCVSVRGNAKDSDSNAGILGIWDCNGGRNQHRSLTVNSS